MAPDQVVLQAFNVPLSSGIVTLRPGDVVKESDYSVNDYAAIQNSVPSPAFAYVLNLPFGPATTAAIPETVALRARGGDTNGRFQASQTIMETAFILDC
jgi:hypothetical protein